MTQNPLGPRCKLQQIIGITLVIIGDGMRGKLGGLMVEALDFVSTDLGSRSGQSSWCVLWVRRDTILPPLRASVCSIFLFLSSFFSPDKSWAKHAFKTTHTVVVKEVKEKRLYGSCSLGNGFKFEFSQRLVNNKILAFRRTISIFRIWTISLLELNSIQLILLKETSSSNSNFLQTVRGLCAIFVSTSVCLLFLLKL